MKYLRNRCVFHLLIRKHCCSKYGCRKHIFVNRFVQALLAEIWSSKNKVHRFLCYYHFFENAETKLFQNWPMFCPILWYSQMICHDTITLCYQTKVTMIAGVISILTYIVLRSRKGQNFFFLTNKAKFVSSLFLV